jgi:hypothetical protein
MAILPKPNHTEVPVLVGRRSTRLSVAVPILVNGTDATGNPFKEHTFTLNVNKHGGEIAVNHLLVPDAEISIENISIGRKGRARVVQRRERRTPNSPYEVSVELLDPENIWGVRFPPSDWDKESPPKFIKSTSEKPVTGKEDVSTPAPVKAAPEAAAAMGAPSAETVTPIEVRHEAAERNELPMAADSRPSPNGAEKSDEPAPKETPASAIPSEPTAPAQPEAASQEPRTAAPPPAAERSSAQADAGGLDEKIASAHSAERRLEELVNRLDSASTRLESVLSEARTDMKAEMEGERAEAKEAARQATQSTLEEFTARLRSEFETSSKELLAETGRRLQEEVSAAVAAYAKQAKTHLSKLTQESGPELEAKQKTAVSLAKEQIAGAAQAAAAEFDAKLKTSAGETAHAAEAEFKASLEKSAAGQVNQFAELLRARTESVLEGTGSLIEKVRQQMQEESAPAQARFRAACQSEADRASSRIAKQLEESSESVRKTGDEANAALWESSKSIKHDLTFKAEKLRKQLADLAGAAEEGFRNYTEVQLKGAREEIRESVRSLAAKSAQEFSEQLQKSADGILESNAPQLQRQAEDAVDLCKGTLETAAQELVQKSRGRLATLALESVEAFSSEARAATEQFTLQLQGTLQEYVAQSAQQVASNLRQAGEAEQQAILSRIEAQGREAGQRVITEIKSRAEGAAKEAADAVYKQIGMATVVLKDWGDQAAARLEAQLNNSLDTIERRVQEFTGAALAAHRAQTEEATREMRRRLEQAARILSAESAEPAPKDPASKEPKS